MTEKDSTVDRTFEQQRKTERAAEILEEAGKDDEAKSTEIQRIAEEGAHELRKIIPEEGETIG